MPTIRASKRINILYLCRINSSRGLMAEAITNAFSGDGFRAYSAGIESIDFAPEDGLAVIERHGIPTEGLHPKLSTEFTGRRAPKFHFVITLCNLDQGEVCPTWPGQPVRAHWNIVQPAPAAGREERLAQLDVLYNTMYRCVNAFLNLPLDVMDKFALAKEIDAIGARMIPSEPGVAAPVADDAPGAGVSPRPRPLPARFRRPSAPVRLA